MAGKKRKLCFRNIGIGLAVSWMLILTCGYFWLLCRFMDMADILIQHQKAILGILDILKYIIGSHGTMV